MALQIIRLLLSYFLSHICYRDGQLLLLGVVSDITVVIIRKCSIFQTSKCRRRQRLYPIVSQVEACQTAKSAERAILHVDYGVAREVQMGQRVESTETMDCDAGQLVIAEVQHL